VRASTDCILRISELSPRIVSSIAAFLGQSSGF
jgi:hypothetical protein